MQGKFSAMRLSKNSFLGKKKKPSVEGYIERIDENEIHGWVVSHLQEPLQLSLRINGIHYPISPVWHERADVAAALGEQFIQSGYTIKIPPSASSAALESLQKNSPIDVFANQIALVNRSKPYSPSSLKTTEREAKKKSISTIEGNIEQINGLEIVGWVIDLQKEDITLALSIDDVTYPVTPVWLERADVANKYGKDFIKCGFSVDVPDELIDIFLLACQRDNEQEEREQEALNEKPNSKRFININIIAADKALRKAKITCHSALDLLPLTFSFSDFLAINEVCGIHVTAKDLHKLLIGQATAPLRISASKTANINFYQELARRNLIQQHTDIARTLLKISLSFDQRPECFEWLGNTYFEQKDFDVAAAYYETAAQLDGVSSKWLFSNLANCKKHKIDTKGVVEAIIDGIEKVPETVSLYNRLDQAIHEYWLKQQGSLEILAVTDDRNGLIAKTNESAEFIYQTYLRAYGAKSYPQYLGQCNLERILIIADMHIPQCVRYRVEQKTEQLELAEKEITVISWLDIADEQEALVFHDVIIFYRVPAEPTVLKAMAQANATGKLTLYEIDDLLFEASYPPPLETYGGFLEINLYIQIVKGMASFNAAARYCRFGIASTQPLANKLETLVFGQRCFIHRNGIDASNSFKQKALESTKPTIDIFYGSGTMAHNSDFNELALPAIERILEEYPQTGLMIAGYLKLPNAFVKRFAGRVKQMPPVKNIKTYWSLLERADINLAVLHDDDINGCKSELKWFEAACLGIPSILSTTANYRDVIRDGEDALMATSAEDWYQHLKALVVNPELRHQLAEKAFARVQAEYSIAALSSNISQVLNQAWQSTQIPERAERKKVALVNVFFPPQSIGGATRVIADNFEVLQKDYQDQFELCVFTSDSEHKEAHQMSLYNYHGARVYRATILWREHMDWQPTDEKMGQLFKAFLQAEQPDIIHFHCIQRLGGGILETALDSKIPYLVTAHDAWWISDYQFLVDANNTVYPEGHPDPYAPYTPPSFTTLSESIERSLYLKDLLQQAGEVLTVSESFAEIYRKNGFPLIQVNKNGISESIAWQAKDTHHTDKVVCGHVGGMAEHKGYFLLKKAITKLQPQNLELLIVDHSHDESYRHETHWGNIPVTFIGRLSQRRIVELYRQIDVLFAPSTWPESYGLVTREAAACGCWIVASSMGGIGEDVIEGKTGFVIEPTLAALTDCLNHIDSQPKIYKTQAPAQTLRRVNEQVQELVAIYQNRTEKND